MLLMDIIKILYNTYKKGAAFTEGQGPDCPSSVRKPYRCEEDEINTAPE